MDFSIYVKTVFVNVRCPARLRGLLDTLCPDGIQSAGPKKTAEDGRLIGGQEDFCASVAGELGRCRDAACYVNLFTSGGTEKLDGAGYKAGTTARQRTGGFWGPHKWRSGKLFTSKEAGRAELRSCRRATAPIYRRLAERSMRNLGKMAAHSVSPTLPGPISSWLSNRRPCIYPAFTLHLPCIYPAFALHLPCKSEGNSLIVAIFS
jgi:hypothetical protein